MNNLLIKYWVDEEAREEGLSEIYVPTTNTFADVMYEARRLIDRDGYASVEVIIPDEENEEVLYFYDGITEEIMF